MRSYDNAERGLSRVNRQLTGQRHLLDSVHNRWVLLGGVVLAAAPLLMRVAGSVVQLTGSLVQAAGGAGVIGGGALGAFIVGIGSAVIAVKGLAKDMKPAQQAYQRYNQVVDQYGAKSKQAAAEQRRLNAALKEAPRGTLALLTNVKQLGDEWDRATAKARGYLIQTANYAIGGARAQLPALAGIVNRNVGAVARTGRTVIDRLLDPANIAIVERISATFRRDLPPAADAAVNLALSFARMVADAGPFVQQFLRAFDRWTIRLDAASRDTQYIQYRMHGMVTEFRNWLHFLGASVRLLDQLFRSATVTHGSLRGITQTFEAWTRWIRDNPIRMQTFFQRSHQGAHDLAQALLFVVHLFQLLSTYLDPLWQTLRVFLGAIAGPLLALLQQIAITMSLLGQAFGGLGGPVAIFLRVLTQLLTVVNFLLQHVPLLGTALAGALIVVGIVRMTTWMARFAGGIGVAIGRMIGLTNQTNVAAAAVARLVAEERVAGVGGIPGVVPLGRGQTRTPGGVILPPGVRGVGAAEAAAAGRGGVLSRARALPGVLRNRLGGLRFRGAAGPIGTGILLGTTGLAMAGVGGGGGAGRYLTNIGTGAAIGATGGAFFGPLGLAVGAGLGGAAGGIYTALAGHGGGDTAVRDYNRALPAFQAQLAGLGGDNPRTISQITQQIGLLHQLRTVLGQSNTQAANATREAVNAQIATRAAVLPGMRAERRHAQHVGAFNLETQLGQGFNIVAQAQGPVAAMEYVRRQALARWARLGPEGKRVLATGMLSWADQMRRANPALTAQFEALKQSIIGKFVTVRGTIHMIHGQILTGTQREWRQIATAMQTPVEQAREQIDRNFTIIQQKAVGSLRAMGFSPTRAAQIVTAIEGGGAAARIARGIARNPHAYGPHRGEGRVFHGPAGGPGGRGRGREAGGGGNLFGLHPGILGVLGEVMGAFPGLQVTSALRPGDRGSYHSLGMAVDIAGPGMGAAAHWIDQRLGGSLLEGIHNTGLSVKNGREVDPGFWGASTWEGHANHIHLAIGDRGRARHGGGGARGTTPGRGRGRTTGPVTAGNLAPGLSGIIGLPGLFTDFTGILVAGAMASRLNSQTSTRGRAAATSGRAAGRTAGSAMALGRQMAAARGWMGAQWSSLKALWTGESGWNPLARNPTSGAFGIPQALPASKMGPAAVGGDPAAQIDWGLNYIGGRYGTPSRAYSTWLGRSPHWYGDGGKFVARRPQLIGVGDKGDEEVTIRPLRKRGVSTGTAGGIHVSVHIERIDATGAPGAIRDMVRGEIRDAIADVATELDGTGLVPDEGLL